MALGPSQLWVQQFAFYRESVLQQVCILQGKCTATYCNVFPLKFHEETLIFQKLWQQKYPTYGWVFSTRAKAIFPSLFTKRIASIENQLVNSGQIPNNFHQKRPRPYIGLFFWNSGNNGYCSTPSIMWLKRAMAPHHDVIALRWTLLCCRRGEGFKEVMCMYQPPPPTWVPPPNKLSCKSESRVKIEQVLSGVYHWLNNE